MTYTDGRTFDHEIEIARQRGIALGEGLVLPVSDGEVVITRIGANSWVIEYKEQAPIGRRL